MGSRLTTVWKATTTMCGGTGTSLDTGMGIPLPHSHLQGAGRDQRAPEGFVRPKKHADASYLLMLLRHQGASSKYRLRFAPDASVTIADIVALKQSKNREGGYDLARRSSRTSLTGRRTAWRIPGSTYKCWFWSCEFSAA